jgi:hypothetical protein
VDCSEIGRNAATPAVHGVADGTLLLAKKQCGAFFGYADYVNGMPPSRRPVLQHQDSDQPGDGDDCRNGPKQKLLAFTQRGHVAMYARDEPSGRSMS